MLILAGIALCGLVPEFFGVLNQGIEDLKFVISAYEKAPAEVPHDLVVMAYDLLGDGYLKKRDKDMARTAWHKVIEIAPETPTA